MEDGPKRLSEWPLIKDAEGKVISLQQNYPHERFQWIAHIIDFSSSYESGWEADTMIGPPRVFPGYGDIRGAWAAKTSRGSKEKLDLGLRHPVHITSVNVFETYNPGHIFSVSLRNEATKDWVEVFHIDVPVENPVPTVARVFSPDLGQSFSLFKADAVRLELDCTNAKSWSEIDCIAVCGLRFLEWTKERHHEFPPAFKRMVRTFLLINNGLPKTQWLPQVLCFEIFKLAALSWPTNAEIEEARTEAKVKGENCIIS